MWKSCVLLFGMSLLAACSAPAVVQVEPPAEEPQRETPKPPLEVPESASFRIPIQFHRLLAPDLRAQVPELPERPVGEAVLAGMIEQLNIVWRQCDIEFTPLPLREHALQSIREATPTEAELAEEERQLLERIGKAPGSGPGAGYFNYVAPLTFLPKKVGPILQPEAPEALGQGSMPVLLLPDARILNPTFGTSLTHATISRTGLLDFFHAPNTGTAIEDTHLVSYGFDADRFYETPSTSGSLAAGSYPNILAHEAGHFLGLAHEEHTLLDPTTGVNNLLTPRQCAHARTFLKKKLGQDVKTADGRSCRVVVSERICRYTAETGETVCGAASGYLEPLLEVYDGYTDAAKSLMCSLEKLFVGTGLKTAALTLDLRAPGETTPRFGVGLRQELLEGFWSVSDFLTWKEQLSFGGDATPFAPPREDLPRYKGRPVDGTNSFLFMVLSHELGHVLHLQREELLTEWRPLSWTDETVPLPENDVPGREQLCFYFCTGGHAPASLAPALYARLLETSFVSSYASQSASEDFAETFAYALWNESKGGALMLQSAPDATYDVLEHYRSKRLEAKRLFMERWLRQ